MLNPFDREAGETAESFREAGKIERAWSGKRKGVRLRVRVLYSISN